MHPENGLYLDTQLRHPPTANDEIKLLANLPASDKSGVIFSPQSIPKRSAEREAAVTLAAGLLMVMLGLASITSIMIVRMPDINSLSLQHRISWPLPKGGGRRKLADACREISSSYRWDLQDITVRLLTRIAIIALFIVGGVLSYMLLERSFSIPSFSYYLIGRASESLFILTPELERPEGMPRYLDQLVGYSISWAVGSIVIYLLAFAASWLVSAIFPVRWVKWAKITDTKGRHNRRGAIGAALQSFLIIRDAALPKRAMWVTATTMTAGGSRTDRVMPQKLNHCLVAAPRHL